MPILFVKLNILLFYAYFLFYIVWIYSKRPFSKKNLPFYNFRIYAVKANSQKSFVGHPTISCVSKCIEKIAFKYIFNHLIFNSLLYKFQSGFIPGYSTTHQRKDLLNSKDNGFATSFLTAINIVLLIISDPTAL
jgi:hypothetical protein